jgi:glycosyltransferase
MKKKKVYIFNTSSRASVYGIGTYMEQLISCLKDSDMKFGIIHLHAQVQEVSINEKDGIEYILIPSPIGPSKIDFNSRYMRNVIYLLRDIIPEEKDTEYIFHLNFMGDKELISSLKKRFRCKILLVAHYTNWSFDLFGDTKKLQAIMKCKNSQLKLSSEKKIFRDVKNDEKTIQKCDHFICVAKHTLDSFRKVIKIDTSKVSIINNALKDVFEEKSYEQKVLIRDKYYINPETKILFFAGRLDEVKGVSFLIEAFKKTAKIFPNTHLFIAGDGDFSRWLSIANNCWHRITFTGKIDRKQLYELYSIADIGIVSSIHEEFGYVALEMMMHKLPIIVSDTGGLSEIIEKDISGLVVPVSTIEGKRVVNENILVDKISFLLNHPDTAHFLGANGRQRFLEKYELSIFNNQILNLYQTI